jgi:hypothetical protein
MSSESMMRFRLLSVALLALFSLIGAALLVIEPTAPVAAGALQVQVTPGGRVATEEELATAQAEWADSEHAATYDEGMGANTTCARCKSPFNWDPSQTAAQQQALDCSSCKRVPGEPRPDLAEGIPVPQDEWHQITCDVCHIPAGDSYHVEPAFWNQAAARYEPVASSTELCAHCHEGRHGFEVVSEQEASEAHQGWECTRCHGDHGGSVACTDCHNPQSGPGAREHSRHTNVNCTACHDGGGLSIWQDPGAHSAHAGEYITRRFAHTLTSWPSHNLASQVNCRRCHHLPEPQSAVPVPEVSCTGCHEHREGAVSMWCTYFQRDSDPRAAWQTAGEE